VVCIRVVYNIAQKHECGPAVDPGTIMNTYLKILDDLNIYLNNSREGQDIPPPPHVATYENIL
jgi:hypothetical protein